MTNVKRNLPHEVYTLKADSYHKRIRVEVNSVYEAIKAMGRKPDEFFWAIPKDSEGYSTHKAIFWDRECQGPSLKNKDVFSQSVEEKWLATVYLDGLNRDGEWCSYRAASEESERIRLCQSGKDKSKRVYTYAKTYGYDDGTNHQNIRDRLERSREEIVSYGRWYNQHFDGREVA